MYDWWGLFLFNNCRDFFTEGQSIVQSFGASFSHPNITLRWDVHTLIYTYWDSSWNCHQYWATVPQCTPGSCLLTACPCLAEFIRKISGACLVYCPCCKSRHDKYEELTTGNDIPDVVFYSSFLLYLQRFIILFMYCDIYEYSYMRSNFWLNG